MDGRQRVKVGTGLIRGMMYGLCSLLLHGCAAQPGPAAVELYTLRGVVTEASGQLRFQPCFERRWWGLLDASPQQALRQFQQQLSGVANTPVYMELTAVLESPQAQRLVVQQLKVAGGTADTCHFDLPGVTFRAASPSPFWVADVNANTVVVKSVNPVGRYTFIVERDEQEDGALEYRERSPRRLPPFLLRLTAGHCVDPQNGTLLDYRARMRLFGQMYEGCARAGQAVDRSPLGLYWYEAQTAEAGNMAVLMKLQDESRVDLVSRRADGATTTQRGRWQLLDSGKLILTLKNREQQEYLLIFSRQANRAFRLERSHTAFLTAGAEFRFWQIHALPGGGPLYDTPPPEVTGSVGAQSEPVEAESGAPAARSAGGLEFRAVPAYTDGSNLTEIFVSE